MLRGNCSGCWIGTSADGRRMCTTHFGIPHKMWDMNSLAGLAGLLLYQDEFALGTNLHPYDGAVDLQHIIGDLSPPPGLNSVIVEGRKNNSRLPCVVQVQTLRVMLFSVAFSFLMIFFVAFFCDRYFRNFFAAASVAATIIFVCRTYLFFT